MIQKNFLLFNVLIMLNLLIRDQVSANANATLMATNTDYIKPIFYYFK